MMQKHGKLAGKKRRSKEPADDAPEAGKQPSKMGAAENTAPAGGLGSGGMSSADVSLPVQLTASAGGILHPVISSRVMQADPRDTLHGVAPLHHVTKEGRSACSLKSIAKKYHVCIKEMRDIFIESNMFQADEKHLKATDKLPGGEFIRLPLAAEARQLIIGTWACVQFDDGLTLPVRMAKYANGRIEMFVHTDDKECKFDCAFFPQLQYAPSCNMPPAAIYAFVVCQNTAPATHMHNLL